ncbi:MAG: RnfABCDGE type electron transport complex subunit B [Clostridiales bacterium]|nr:RnfABCDGE type electron transport complex subunit B [Clostridiales bacterium]
MSFTSILVPALILGGMGLLFGIGLGIAAIKFEVEADPLIPLIREALPGANCGGCGYAGCDALAEAIAKSEAKPTACPVGGAACAAAIGEIMGIPVEPFVRRRALVRCGGCESKSNFRYSYVGLNDCKAAMQLAGGGSKSCVYGCLGGGSCIAACKFGAISFFDGIAAVDENKCTACGMCVKSCPKNLIALVPYNSKQHVLCNSKDNGKAVRQNCKIGCIGCKLCEKACPTDAVHVQNFLASIDYEKCVGCGACAKKCPSRCIEDLQENSNASASATAL